MHWGLLRTRAVWTEQWMEWFFLARYGSGGYLRQISRHGWMEKVSLHVGTELIDYRGSSIKKSKFAFSMFQPLNQSLEIWSNVSRVAQWILEPTILAGGFPGGSVVKNPPATHETKEMWVWSLSRKDCLEEGVSTHSSILAWEIAWTEEPGGLQSTGLQELDKTEHAFTLCLHYPGCQNPILSEASSVLISCLAKS